MNLWEKLKHTPYYVKSWLSKNSGRNSLSIIGHRIVIIIKLERYVVKSVSLDVACPNLTIGPNNVPVTLHSFRSVVCSCVELNEKAVVESILTLATEMKIFVQFLWPRALNSRKCDSYNVSNWRGKFVVPVTSNVTCTMELVCGVN